MILPLFTNFAGFTLQTIPCMLLCLLPFPKESFIVRRQYLISFFCIVLLVSAALFSSIICFPELTVRHGVFSLNVFANFFMLLVLVLCMVIFFRAVRESVWKKVLVLLLVLDYAIFIYNSVIAAPSFLELPFWGVYSVESDLLYFIFTLLSFPFLCRFMRRKLSVCLKRIEPKDLRHALLMVLLLTVLYTCVLFCLALIEDSLEEQLILFLIATHLLCSTCLAAAIRFLLWEVQKAVEESHYKSLLQLQQFQYQKITDELNSYHRSQHDMRHHFRVIDALLQEGKTEEAAVYIAECTGIIDSQEHEFFCKEPMVNALLQYYVGEARQQNIRCDIRARIDRCPIDSADMTVLLGNCLENAIASCLRSQAPRLIRLNIRIVNSTLAILMENSCDAVSPSGSMRLDTGDYLPARAFRSMRSNGGQGLSSMEHTAAKYGGTAEFRFEKPMFYTRISLELPPSSPDSATGMRP